MDDTTTFRRGPARRPAPRIVDPLLQWATGLQTKQRAIYAGWLLEVGQDQGLDDVLAEGFSQIEIKHGTGKIVKHWQIPTANLFVLCDGVQSIGEMKGTEERFGIAFGWQTLEGGRQVSKLFARVMIHEVLDQGMVAPLKVTLKGTITGDMLAALTRQFEVFEAVNAIRKAASKPAIDPPFYAASLAIGPGADVARGNGGQTKDIAPPIAYLPERIDEQYIKNHWIRPSWMGAIEDLMDDTIRWSVALSKLIGAGSQEGEQEL